LSAASIDELTRDPGESGSCRERFVAVRLAEGVVVGDVWEGIWAATNGAIAASMAEEKQSRTRRIGGVGRRVRLRVVLKMITSLLRWPTLSGNAEASFSTLRHIFVKA
jgi:hypothetical protein